MLTSKQKQYLKALASKMPAVLQIGKEGNTESVLKSAEDALLTRIIAENNIKSVTVLRMEVPCCGGLERAAVAALKNSEKFIPWQVVTITIDGKIKED